MSDNEVSNTQGVAISHDLFGLKAAAEVYRSLSCAISGVSPLNEEFLQYISKTLLYPSFIFISGPSHATRSEQTK